MTANLRCLNGHEWPASTIGSNNTCPECGADSSEAVPETSGSDDIAAKLKQHASTADTFDQTLIVESARDNDTKTSVPQAATEHGDAPSPSSNSPGNDEIDLQVPGYDILGELGQGAMGIVYKARQQRLNRIVALKMLMTAGHDLSLSRAQTESEAVARLQHPNIVQIFEVQEHNNAMFFAFEFIDGGPLVPAEITSPRHAAELVETIARGVHYAHDHGVIHRDLKPDNILVTSDGVPKVADFGLAKKTEVDAGQTQAGSIMGTPYYMSPEQASGQNTNIGPATDIYSLGSILYKLLTQETPFDDPSVIKLLQKVRTTEPVPPSKRGCRVHADLETICLKCLEKEPAARYLTAAELADDLRRFLDGEPIEAKPISTLARGLRWVRKRAIAVSLTASLLLLTSAVTLFAISSTRNAEAQLAARSPITIEQPAGLPSFSVPSDNPVTKGKVELGKQLFFDRRLSADNSIGCVDCHDPKAGWADPRVASIGIRHQKGTRNSPPVSNAAYLHFLFWDGRATSLEEQATKPITNPVEMGVESLDDLVAKLATIEGYRLQFDRVFDDGITPQNIGAAITAFERTLVAGNSPFDRFTKGDKSALSEAAQRGITIFFKKGHCSACHSGPLYSDGGFHNIGVGLSSDPIDDGRFAVTGRRGDRGSFKTPSLRDIARTAPYMHDGSLKTLEEVVDFYDQGGVRNPQLSEDIYPLKLSADEKSDLVQFLRLGLTSDQYPQVDPPVLPE